MTETQEAPAVETEAKPVKEKMGGTALVVLSGGQDSTTCLGWAKERYGTIHAITFDYGQRHVVEIDAARKVAVMIGVDSHEILTLPDDVLAGTSPLTDKSKEVGHYSSADKLPGGLEATFVPGRNLLFLALAANRAYVLGAQVIVMGVCQEDFGGYHDCRQKFIDAAKLAIGEALTGHAYGGPDIKTPLMFLTKAESVTMAAHNPVTWEALAYTHTCYDGQYPPNPFNHASLLRAKGFNAAKKSDPLIERAIAEGKLAVDYPRDGLVEGTVYGNADTWAATVRDSLGRDSDEPAPVKKKKVKAPAPE